MRDITTKITNFYIYKDLYYEACGCNKGINRPLNGTTPPPPVQPKVSQPKPKPISNDSTYKRIPLGRR